MIYEAVGILEESTWEDLISRTENKIAFPNITVEKGSKENIEFSNDGWWDISTPNYDKGSIETLLTDLLKVEVEIVNSGIAMSM
jgi:hypothetical protein